MTAAAVEFFLERLLGNVARAAGHSESISASIVTELGEPFKEALRRGEASEWVRANKASATLSTDAKAFLNSEKMATLMQALARRKTFMRDLELILLRINTGDIPAARIDEVLNTDLYVKHNIIPNSNTPLDQIIRNSAKEARESRIVTPANVTTETARLVALTGVANTPDELANIAKANLDVMRDHSITPEQLQRATRMIIARDGERAVGLADEYKAITLLVEDAKASGKVAKSITAPTAAEISAEAARLAALDKSPDVAAYSTAAEDMLRAMREFDITSAQVTNTARAYSRIEQEQDALRHLATEIRTARATRIADLSDDVPKAAIDAEGRRLNLLIGTRFEHEDVWRTAEENLKAMKRHGITQAMVDAKVTDLRATSGIPVPGLLDEFSAIRMLAEEASVTRGDILTGGLDLFKPTAAELDAEIIRLRAAYGVEPDPRQTEELMAFAKKYGIAKADIDARAAGLVRANEDGYALSVLKADAEARIAPSTPTPRGGSPLLPAALKPHEVKLPEMEIGRNWFAHVMRRSINPLTLFTHPVVNARSFPSDPKPILRNVINSVDDFMHSRGLIDEIQNLQKDLTELSTQLRADTRRKDEILGLINTRIAEFADKNGTQLEAFSADMDRVLARIEERAPGLRGKDHPNSVLIKNDGRKVALVEKRDTSDIIVFSHKQALVAYVTDMRDMARSLQQADFGAEGARIRALASRTDAAAIPEDIIQSLNKITEVADNAVLRFGMRPARESWLGVLHRTPESRPGVPGVPEQQAEALERQLEEGYYNRHSRARKSGDTNLEHTWMKLEEQYTKLKQENGNVSWDERTAKSFSTNLVSMYDKAFDQEALYTIRHLKYRRGDTGLDTYPPSLIGDLKLQPDAKGQNRYANDAHYKEWVDSMGRAADISDSTGARTMPFLPGRQYERWYAENSYTYRFFLRYRGSDWLAKPGTITLVKDFALQPAYKALHFILGAKKTVPNGSSEGYLRIMPQWGTTAEKAKFSQSFEGLFRNPLTRAAVRVAALSGAVWAGNKGLEVLFAEDFELSLELDELKFELTDLKAQLAKGGLSAEATQAMTNEIAAVEQYIKASEEMMAEQKTAQEKLDKLNQDVAAKEEAMKTFVGNPEALAAEQKKLTDLVQERNNAQTALDGLTEQADQLAQQLGERRVSNALLKENNKVLIDLKRQRERFVGTADEQADLDQRIADLEEENKDLARAGGARILIPEAPITDPAARPDPNAPARTQADPNVQTVTADALVAETLRVRTLLEQRKAALGANADAAKLKELDDLIQGLTTGGVDGLNRARLFLDPTAKRLRVAAAASPDGPSNPGRIMDFPDKLMELGRWSEFNDNTAAGHSMRGLLSSAVSSGKGIFNAASNFIQRLAKKDGYADDWGPLALKFGGGFVAMWAAMNYISPKIASLPWIVRWPLKIILMIGLVMGGGKIVEAFINRGNAPGTSSGAAQNSAEDKPAAPAGAAPAATPPAGTAPAAPPAGASPPADPNAAPAAPADEKPGDQPVVHNLPYNQGNRPIPRNASCVTGGNDICSPNMGDTTVFAAANGIPTENLSNPFQGMHITAANEGHFHYSPEDAHLPESQRRVIDAGSAVQSDSMSIHVPRANLLSSNVLADLSMSGGRNIPVNAPVFEMLNRSEIGIERVAHESPESNVIYASFSGRGGRGNVLAQPGMQYGELPVPAGWS